MAVYAKAQAKREARLAVIREMAGTMPAWQIAEALHIAEGTLKEYCCKYDVSLRYNGSKPIPPEERRYIMQAREAGIPYDIIAANTGRTTAQVRTIVSNTKARGIQWK